MSEIDIIKKHLSGADPVLAKIISAVPYPSIEQSGNVFHDLMSLVIEQQIHYRSTKKTFERLLNQVGISELTPDNFHLLEEIGFGNARLSENKFHTLNGVIELFTEQNISWDQLSNDEIKNQLKQIKGIGAKTIDALLIYTFQRDDVFIHDDYHIHKIIPALYGVDADKKLSAKIKEMSNTWSPYASHAFRYLLAWKDHQKRK